MRWYRPCPVQIQAVGDTFMRHAHSASLTLSVCGVEEYFCFWCMEGKEECAFGKSSVGVFGSSLA